LQHFCGICFTKGGLPCSKSGLFFLAFSWRSSIRAEFLVPPPEMSIALYQTEICCILFLFCCSMGKRDMGERDIYQQQPAVSVSCEASKFGSNLFSFLWNNFLPSAEKKLNFVPRYVCVFLPGLENALICCIANWLR
jgi:hypothetical protein